MTTKPNPVPILTPLPPDGAVLRRRAVAVRHVDAYVKQIIGQMKATLRARDDGVGLAAPQIGIPLRIVVYRENPRAAIKTLVNPEFLPVRVRHESKVAEETAEEQCLSLPGRLLEIPRKTFVWVQGRNEDGRLEQYPASGFVARILQHGVDHLEGVLLTDRSLHGDEAASRVAQQAPVRELMEAA